MKKIDEKIDWRSICPISSALDVIGDKWSLLIIRDLIIHEALTYSQFLESPEQISTNILAARLDLLTRMKLIERVHPDLSSRNNAYKLTKSGKALEPVIKDLGKWAGKYLSEYHSKIVQL